MTIYIIAQKTQMKNQKNMFQSPLLEFLSKSNPYIISILHFTLICSVIYLGNIKCEFNFITIGFFFMSGLFFWTFAEYLIHRFVFHLTSQNSVFKLVHYALHGHHHENPTDRNHLFMPPFPVVLIVIILFGFFYLILREYTYYFFPGFQLGYLIYSMIHYSLHVKSYKKGIMKKLWIHHGKHHFENSSMRYGVSTTIWDSLFRTLPPNKQ